MNTYSHLLMTAVLREGLKKRDIVVPTKAALLGSVAPDLPLFALTLGYWIGRQIKPLPVHEGLFGPGYDALYFSNPFWIVLHNFFHAPIMIALFATLGYVGMRRGKVWGTGVFWFAIACGFHSLIDIPTHGDDGPLLLFPFNWSLRYHSPISYWDSRFYGEYFAVFEHLLVLAMLGFFGVKWFIARRGKAVTPSGEETAL